MIEGLFGQSNYVASKKMLDVTALRHEAIASNLANLETPHYQRVDVSSNFETQLHRAVGSQDSAQIANLKPTVTVDTQAVAQRPDGNTVDLEGELMKLHQNSLEHSLETQLISGALLKLRMAITGRTV